MRILFVNSMRSVGGGERWLAEVAAALLDRGHDIAFALREGGEAPTYFGAFGCPTVELPMRGDLDPQSIAGLAGFARRFEAELMSVNIQRAVRIGATAARVAGVRAVVERRGLLFRLKPSSLNRFVYRRLVSRVIANCDAIRADIVGSGVVSSGRVTVIPNGIDPDRVRTGGGDELRRELDIEAGAPVVAVVGRLAPDKGHGVALKAFADVVKEIPRARLVVAGGGKLGPALEGRAGELLPPGSVHFLGHTDDVGAVFDAADAVLVTSFREGMPHVVLEAMAAGTPVVATAVAGIPEMIENDRDGVLVQTGSHTAAAAGVLTVLTDRDRAARLAASARSRVEREFTLSGMIDSVERCFREEVELAAAAGRRSERSAGGEGEV